MPERATGQLCSDFLENSNYLFLRIRVKLSGMSIVIESKKNRHENTVCRDWSDSKEFGVEVPK